MLLGPGLPLVGGGIVIAVFGKVRPATLLVEVVLWSPQWTHERAAR